MNTHTLIGIAASICTAVSLLPQLIKIAKDKQASDISYWMLAILVVGLILWIIYGAMDEDYIIIISNSISLLINVSVLILNIYYSKRQTS
jgi:MtN3 and saliva related transmembrane protein